MRNVYKPANRIANSIKTALTHAPKILLTATLTEFTIRIIRFSKHCR